MLWGWNRTVGTVRYETTETFSLCWRNFADDSYNLNAFLEKILAVSLQVFLPYDVRFWPRGYIFYILFTLPRGIEISSRTSNKPVPTALKCHNVRLEVMYMPLLLAETLTC